MNLIILSYEWPGKNSGSEIAIESALIGYCEYFGKITFVGCTEKNVPKGSRIKFPNVNFVYVPIRLEPTWRRFVKNGLSEWPAMTKQFRDREVIQQVDDIIRKNSSSKDTIILSEHIPVSIFFQLCKSANRGQILCIRSFDVFASAFKDIPNGKKLLERKLWEFEIARIQRFERLSITSANYAWSITDEDYQDYTTIDLKMDGVIGVSLHNNSNISQLSGDTNSFLYLGSFDERKLSGINTLVNYIWPKVMEKCPNACLHLGGKGSHRYGCEELNIKSHGFVECEKAFMKLGSTVINPQITGSGIKLKSLNAMASGKLLISFENGTKGIGGESDIHYIQCSEPDEMAEKIISISLYNEQNFSIRKNAMTLIETNFSQEKLNSQIEEEFRKLESRTQS